MVGSIRGSVLKRSRNFLIVDVQGVGYKVFVNAKTLANAKENSAITLQTHLYMREDVLSLYGFEKEEELYLFENLISISGIGPKMALGILSSATVEQIQQAVAKAETPLFLSVPGIGRKSAQRIIIDLQTKLGKLEDLDLSELEARHEVVAALKSLGYTLKEAQEAVKEVDSDLPIEVQIKEALKRLSVK